MDISSIKKTKSKTSRKYRRAVREGPMMVGKDSVLCVDPAQRLRLLSAQSRCRCRVPAGVTRCYFSSHHLIYSYSNHTALTMATSMAAAIAASLPAPQAASVPAAPVHEPIPASMSKLVDMEAEIPLNLVQLEGLVCPAVVAPHFACYRLWYYRSFRKSSNTAQNPTQQSTVYFSDWTSMVF